MLAKLLWMCLASVEANRINVHESSQSKSKSGASCETLENRFHDRVTGFRASLDAMDQDASVSSMTQVRYAMRINGIIRVMRRAQTCSWVIENNSDDMDDLHGIVQELLASNPCADAAKTELQAGIVDGTEEIQAGTLARTLTILTSDSCVVSDPEQTQQADLTGNTEAELQQTEDEVQDGLEDLWDRTEREESALLQTNLPTMFTFFRVVGVVFLLLILIMGCVTMGAAIGVFLGYCITMLGWHLGLVPSHYHVSTYPIVYVLAIISGTAAGAVSFMSCAATALTRLTGPRLS
jgi:hypothetical protein